MTDGDLISRHAVKEFVEYIQTIKDKHNDEGLSINYGTICDLVIRGWKLVENENVINDMLPVTPQPKMGKWIKQVLPVKPFGEDTVLCDQCAFMTDKDSQYNYCPNCGAKMEGEIEE